MATTYYVEDKRGSKTLFSTAAKTAVGMASAAMTALHIDEYEYFRRMPDEQLADIMQTLNCTKRTAAIYSAVALEGIEIYPCDYIRNYISSTVANKRHYKPLTLDWDTNEFYF